LDTKILNLSNVNMAYPSKHLLTGEPKQSTWLATRSTSPRGSTQTTLIQFSHTCSPRATVQPLQDTYS
jgi:hypothetical protein